MTKLASSRPWACIVNDKNGINKNARLTDIHYQLSLGLSKHDERNFFALLVMKPSHRREIEGIQDFSKLEKDRE